MPKPLSDRAAPLARSALLLTIGRQHALVQVRGLDIEDKFDERAGDERGRKVRGEVVVQEELASHDEEGDVVGGPGEEEEAGRVVEARAGAWAPDWG